MESFFEKLVIVVAVIFLVIFLGPFLTEIFTYIAPDFIWMAFCFKAIAVIGSIVYLFSGMKRNSRDRNDKRNEGY